MKRIVQVDFFRGLFLIIITTNHIISYQNIISYFTYEFIGWVTAAEGFVFLSGLTAGIVYSRKLVEKGEKFIAKAAINRAWTIYKYHIVLFLLVTLILFSHPVMKESWYHQMKHYEFLFQQPTLALLLGSLLFYKPSFLDILPMYAIFMLLLPTTLKYFHKGAKLPILLVSFVVYLAGTFGFFSSSAVDKGVATGFESGYFNILSWQFLFILGLFLGYLTYQGKVKKILVNKSVFAVCLAICAILLTIKTIERHQPGILNLQLDYWVSRENLGPLRLLNFLAMTSAMGFIVVKFKGWFTFKPLCYLGKHSLEVFAFHILLIILFKPFEEFTNQFNAIKVTNTFYFYPWASIMLLLIFLPSLFTFPVLKNIFAKQKQSVKLSS